MAHTRARHADSLIKKALTYAPCVGLMGMRQVGKTTLLLHYAKTYHTFDDDRFIVRFEKEGHGIIEKSPYPLALDEIQKYPPTFDMLKLSIDKINGMNPKASLGPQNVASHGELTKQGLSRKAGLKKPGRFLVSGSVRFGSRHQIRESLTGRIVSIELLPFTLSECHHRSLSSFLKLLKEDRSQNIVTPLAKKVWANEKQILHYKETGGLPGICFRHDNAVRSDLLATHLETLLARDIHLVKKTNLSFNKLLLFLTEIAKTQGLPINLAYLARIVGTSAPTIRSLLDALQGLFLIQPYGNTYFLEDLGLSSYLMPNTTPLSRLEMIRLLYSEFRAQLVYQLKHEASFKPYQTRGGIDIPFLIEFKTGKKVAIVVEEEDTPSNKALKTLTWAKKRFTNLNPLILLRSQKAFETSTGIVCLPWTWVF